MVRITESRETDLDSLRELFLRVRQATFSRADSTSFGILDFDKETEGEYILVALWGECVVGFISVWMQDNFIHHLFVDVAYQQKGIGTALLSAIQKRTKLPLTLKCLESNTRALDFYKRRGFNVKGSGANQAGAFVLLELDQGNTQGTTEP